MRTSYKIDEFTDYAGNVRKFIIVAVSLPKSGLLETFSNDKQDFVISNSFEKILSIGVSVCRPTDTFDKDLGITIAKGKAIKNQDHALYVTDSGLVNDTLVNALLDQEVAFFKKDPGHYLAGYDTDAQKYFNRKQLEEYKNNLKEPAKVTYNYLKEASAKDVYKMSKMLCLEKQL